MMKVVGIIGLGRVGRTLLAYLADGRAEKILIYDENPEVFSNRYVAELIKKGNVARVEDPLGLKDAELIIKSPGVSNEAKWVLELDRSGVTMIDEIEFVWTELGKPKTIAVTGTNGKSTTTAWTAEILKGAGRNVFCGGNLAPGRPFSEALSDRPYDVYVIEVSTFQLERCPSFRPDIGILTNITADHLNRHTIEQYVDLKLSLFKNNTPQDAAVLNADDFLTSRNIDKVKGRRIFFSLSEKNKDTYLKDEQLMARDVAIAGTKELKLPGLHNVANALAASAAALEYGINPGEIRKGLTGFKGLPHRMEYLGELDGKKVYNNSMCTNPEAFYHSVKSFEEDVVVIAGGTEKNLPIEPFIRGVKERVKFLVLFGENAERLVEILRNDSQFSSYVIVESLRAALDAALNASKKGERIIFAPGFASFGNFKNFEERGHAFIQEFRERSKRV